MITLIFKKTGDPLHFSPIKVADFYILAAKYAKEATHTCWNYAANNNK